MAELGLAKPTASRASAPTSRPHFGDDFGSDFDLAEGGDGSLRSRRPPDGSDES